MPSTYTGLVANVTTKLTATIVGATNASPIVIQTSAPHLFQTGDLVAISGVGGNTAANNSPNDLWSITVQDSTHFSLDGSTGNAAYTSGGTATDYSITPTLTVPSDGDAEDAASVLVALKGLGDRTQWLAKQRGAYRLINTYTKQTTDDTFSAWSTNASLGSSSWASLASADPMFTFTNPSPTCDQGDLFEIDFGTTAVPTAVSDAAAPAIALGVSLSGVSSGATTLIAGTGKSFTHGGLREPIGLKGYVAVAAGGAKQTFNFAIMGLGNIASPPALNLIGHRILVVKHWRPQT